MKHTLLATLSLAALIVPSLADVVYLADDATVTSGSAGWQPFTNTNSGTFDGNTITSGSTTDAEALTYQNRPAGNGTNPSHNNGRFETLTDIGSVVYTFTDSKDLSGLLLWNYSEYWSGSLYNERGVTRADITIHHSGGTVTLEDQAFTLTPEDDGENQLVSAQQVDFGADYTDVTSIEFEDLQGDDGQYLGWHDIAFIGLPESTVNHRFWDIDGATPGAGGTTPAGTWDAATANWSESADGDAATAAWQTGMDAIFAAGTDATGSYTVTVSGTPEAALVRVEDGDVTLAGSGLSLVDAAKLQVADPNLLTVETPLVGTAGLKTSGEGTIVLSGTNTYSGATVIGGTVEILGGSSLPDTDALQVTGSLLLFADESVGPLSGDGSVDIDTFTLTLGGAADSTFDGMILGPGNLIKTGAATLTMTGAPSDIDGTLTINGGTVALATNNYQRALGNTSGIVVEDTTTLRIDSVNVLHVNGGTDFTPVTVNAGGTVELNASHNHFGPLALNGGTVTGMAAAAYRSQYTTFDDVVTVAGTQQSVITDTTGLSYALGGAAIEFNVAATGDASGIDLDFQSPLIDVEDVGGDGLMKTGPGTMSFAGVNSYTGDTIVEGGVLRVNGDSLADGARLTIDGGVVEPTGTEIVSALFFGAVQQAVGSWGATGSGADNIDNTHFAGTAGVVLIAGPGYDAWAGGFVGFTDADPDLDFENDGLASGIEWVVGGDPTANDAAGITPTFDNATNPDDFLFTYRRTFDALDDPNTTIVVEYGSDLNGWTTAEDGVDGVTITEDIDGAGLDIDLIEVAIPRALAIGEKLFVRLKVTVLTP